MEKSFRRPENFIRYMKTLPSNTLFFTTGDNEAVILTMIKEFGPRIFYLPRKVWDRRLEQIYYALADAIILSRTKLNIGSGWSSFSELIRRFSDTPMKIAGFDF